MSVLYNITTEALEAAGFRALHAGDDYDHKFTVTRGGSALDLTGATIWLTIKEDSVLTDAQAALQIETPTDVEITNATGGEFVAHLSAAATAGLEGQWFYDIKAKLSDGTIIRLARGLICFLACITRATS